MELRCENGAVLQGETVVGADGIHSVARQLVSPASKPVVLVCSIPLYSADGRNDD